MCFYLLVDLIMNMPSDIINKILDNCNDLYLIDHKKKFSPVCIQIRLKRKKTIAELLEIIGQPNSSYELKYLTLREICGLPSLGFII